MYWSRLKQQQQQPGVHLSGRLTFLLSDGYPIKNTPWNPSNITGNTMMPWGASGGPMMPRGTGLQHSRWNFFQAGYWSAFPASKGCSVHWEAKFTNDTFKPVHGILVYWHISTMYFDEDKALSLSKIPVEMCQFTRIPMARLSMSVLLLNFSEWTMPSGSSVELHSEK